MGRKKQTRTLLVYQNATRVGVLVQSPSGALSFQYESSWLDRPHSFPISLSLPLQEGPFSGARVLHFFDNLLPDNTRIRKRIGEIYKTPSTRPFDLLSAIGRDCVGAIQFLLEDSEPPTLEAPAGQPLSEAAIAARLRGLSFHPLGMGEDDFRISIAGAQEKTALLKKGKKWMLPLGATPTTHILKPPMGLLHNGIDLSTSVENEWLCLKIAALLGCEVPDAEIHKFEDQKCLVVERFDRRWNQTEGVWLRLPQEDICQALGLDPGQKYEADGGPGIIAIMNLLNGSDERDIDRDRLMRSQLIFYLLAATDGHAKNFSLFLNPQGFRMTPIYDVMSVFPAMKKHQIESRQVKLAMAVGRSRHYHIRDITMRHFEQTAQLCGYSQRSLVHMIEDLKDRVQQDLVSKIEFPAGFPEEIADTILTGLKKQAQKL